jgi:hypothetical protein
MRFRSLARNARRFVSPLALLSLLTLPPAASAGDPWEPFRSAARGPRLLPPSSDAETAFLKGNGDLARIQNLAPGVGR